MNDVVDTLRYPQDTHHGKQLSVQQLQTKRIIVYWGVGQSATSTCRAVT